MGINTSKPSNEAPTVASAKKELNTGDSSDPRSPTPEITRTPLHNKTTGKHNITKNVDLRKTFENANGEEKLIHNNPILSAVIKNHLQSYDPRSPTQDFERTPIIISKSDDVPDDKKLLRLQSDNCASPVLRAENDDSCDSCAEASEKSPELMVTRNLCDGFNNFTLDDTIKDAEEPLCSSTASNEAIESNISSESQQKPTFLETNFDYVENNNKFEDSEENIDSNEEDEADVPVFQILDNDPRSPSIGIERTPIVVAKIEEDSNVETMSDDTLIKVLQNTNTELRQTGIKSDKNEGLLIYEDDAPKLSDTPKKSKSASNSGSRTPLSCMKNKADVGHTRSKSANTLYDPKNQKNVLSKIPKRVSHIPRLKCLSKQSNLGPAGSSVSLKNISKATAIGGDCENTPPHSHRDRWDKDNSIVL
ncbi:uncharacterized protein LOC111353132 [Spodoptera litura]|uniref:Uncharacterized protein LOC111353132 n=1 Tax=Spodoptera litura TaxID=69820 RepID=A0A9J7E5W2_SPOLT|nr:uncharacterized protein LOC111353132 [Spodoptera litura]